MARSAIEQVVEINLAQFGPAAAKQKHIEIARAGLAAFLARQQERPAYRIEVDGHVASSEASVKPFGVIVYRFMRMPQIARFAIVTARELSPVASGRYQHSWFLLADDREVTEMAVPETVQRLILCNEQPYSRKINVRGARLRGVPPGIVERVRQLTLRRYGAIVNANIEYITLKGGHVLKRTRRSAKAGRPLTYLALVITPRV